MLCAALLCLMCGSALWGCSAGQRRVEQEVSEGSFKDRLQTLVGTEEASLDSGLEATLEVVPGPDLMDAQCLPDGKKELEYEWMHEYVMPSKYVQTGMWEALSPFPPSREQGVIKKCTIWFTVEAGRVVTFRYEGEGCTRFVARNKKKR